MVFRHLKWAMNQKRGGNTMKSAEKRSGEERRESMNRRIINDPLYQGPERRNGLERRGGNDQRQTDAFMS
jgi:hypothetical protein